MKTSTKIIILFLCLVLSNNIAEAGVAPPPPTTGTTPPCWPPPCIPIDGGISLLAVAGAAFAGKKLYDKRKKQSSNSGL